MDTKGRMSLPAPFRESLSAAGEDRVWLTINQDGCLVGYSPTEWNKVFEQVTQAKISGREARRLRRILAGRSKELTIDKQGRVLIPLKLRESAELEKDLVLLGLGTKFEIWSRANWETEMEFSPDEMEETLEKLADLGLIL